MSILPTIFIPHGGGPCFDMDWPAEVQQDVNELGEWLSQVPASLNSIPKKILIITAHWEEADFTVSTNPQPGMVYDYSGFREHTYQLRYPASGSAELAEQIVDLGQSVGIRIERNATRGFDHGTFVPLRKMFPNADIPVVQMSIKRGLNPTEHLALGTALKSLREEGVLILGSGMSYHNMFGFMSQRGVKDSEAFDHWLTETVEGNVDRRNQRLTNWKDAPSARDVHPREEHLLPLMVIAGAAGQDTGKKVFAGHFGGSRISGFQFG